MTYNIHMGRSKLFYPGLIWVMVATIFMTSACNSKPASAPFSAQAKPAEATATASETPTPSLTPSPPPTATLLPSATQSQITTPTIVLEPVSGYTIQVTNPNAWEAHLFVDNLYLMTIPQNESATYTGIQAGTHTFHYCESRERLSCAPPVMINITGDIAWEMGQLPTALLVPASATPTTTPTLSLPTPVSYQHYYYIVKFNNILPWTIYVFRDEKLFLSIPKQSYLTYTALPAGKYTFEYCLDKEGEDCFASKTVELATDTEFWVMP